MQISVVMTAYNRKPELIRTLRSYTRSKSFSFVKEVIVVDDGGSQEHRLEDLVGEFPFLKVLRLDPKNKTWFNPCIPYNKGFDLVTGDVVVITNAECLHVGDVFSHIVEKHRANSYTVFGTYSLDQRTTSLLDSVDWSSDRAYGQVFTCLQPMVEGPAYGGDDPRVLGWYQHSVLRPDCLHFLSCLDKSDLDELKGFDERFAEGIAFDDLDFLARVQRKGLEIIQIDALFCVHQWHTAVGHRGILEYQKKYDKNRALFGITSREKTYRAIRLPFYR